jgi:dTDP-4-amino-4,6-dideoxygalactose transaminase
MNNRKLNVTESFIPAMEAYTQYLQRAFDSKWLTNRSELTRELEGKLKHFLGLDHLTLMTNGTLPAQAPYLRRNILQANHTN